MAMTCRFRWTDADVEREIRAMARSYGRMPSAREMALHGRTDISNQVSRRGGFRQWAKRLGLKTKSSETLMGQLWELHEADLFHSLGMVVERQSTKSPFDLLVDGRRVDVKSAHRSQHGFAFAGLKNGRDADVFDLLCIEGGDVMRRFVVPASEARVSTLTISPLSLSGRGTYSDFMGIGALAHPLSGLAAA